MICERCGTVFCWDGADEGTLTGRRKRYCGVECSRRGKGNLMAQEARRRPRKHRRERQLRDCLNRAKNPYENREEAAADATRVRSESGVTLYPYECRCGWWHLTSQEQATAGPSPEVQP